MKGSNSFAHNVTSVLLKKELEEHKRAVHEGVKFPCTQCDKRFTHKGNLEEHKRAVHEGVKFPCTQCDKRFTKKGYLEEHKRAVHEGVKFPCTQFFLHIYSKG